MKKKLLVALGSLIAFSSFNSFAEVPVGTVDEKLYMNPVNEKEVMCLKEVQKVITPILKSVEMEKGVKYKFKAINSLTYKNLSGLRVKVDRVDGGLNDKVANLDYYWLEERGSMCEPMIFTLDQSPRIGGLSE